MKSIMLSVVVIGALITAALGGTFAHFSDTEESSDNEVQVGSMDLKIYTKVPVGGPYDDPNVPVLFSAIDIQPCDSEDLTIQLRNTGQPDGDLCYVYMHIKNVRCEDVPDKLGNPRPEPEVVAEDGGWLGQVLLPGMGKTGDTCDLPDYITLTIYYPWDQAAGTGPVVYTGPMSGVVCTNTLLGELRKCETKDLHVTIHVPDLDEDDLIAAGKITPPAVPAPGDGGYFDGTDPDIIEKCWDKWPTNALMKDKVLFDILFSLVQG